MCSKKKLENTEAYAVTLLASVEVRNLAKTTRNVILFGKIYLQVPLNHIKMQYVRGLLKNKVWGGVIKNKLVAVVTCRIAVIMLLLLNCFSYPSFLKGVVSINGLYI